MTPEERIEKIKQITQDAQADNYYGDNLVYGAILTELDHLKAELKAPSGREGE